MENRLHEITDYSLSFTDLGKFGQIPSRNFDFKFHLEHLKNTEYIVNPSETNKISISGGHFWINYFANHANPSFGKQCEGYFCFVTNSLGTKYKILNSVSKKNTTNCVPVKLVYQKRMVRLVLNESRIFFKCHP